MSELMATHDYWLIKAPPHCSCANDYCSCLLPHAPPPVPRSSPMLLYAPSLLPYPPPAPLLPSHVTRDRY